MRILMVASEAAPFAKTGGLADVLGALPQALVRAGHEVDVVMPRYRGMPEGGDPFSVPLGPQTVDLRVGQTTRGGVRFAFVDAPAWFDRDALYGMGGHDYADNPERFALFGRAALEWARAQGVTYDVVHAHDWQAGLVPVWLDREYVADPHLGRASRIFTIHNLAYQGTFDASWLPRLGFGWDLFTMAGLEFWGRMSFLKAGITFSDRITTVSPTYAREIQTPESGFGFDGLLRFRAADLVGIVNGIDYDRWDPASDPFLVERYDVTSLDRKRANTVALMRELGLPEVAGSRPVVGMISRLVDQKGYDLIAALADELPRLDATFVLLGTGDRRYEDLWLGLASRHPDRFGVRIGFDEGLAHRIEAGSDLFLMPSRFEPCGLNQMYSLRYGTLPLVRATGGLSDTVRNLDPVTGEGTGFVFGDYLPQALFGTLRWALGIYTEKALWRRMQEAGMRQDFSWDASARDYVSVYERARA